MLTEMAACDIVIMPETALTKPEPNRGSDPARVFRRGRAHPAINNFPASDREHTKGHRMGAAESLDGAAADADGSGFYKRHYSPKTQGKCMERGYPKGAVCLHLGAEILDGTNG